MKRIVAALALLLALTACGGGSKGGSSSGVDHRSAKAIASALDNGGFACTGWTPNTEVIGAREDGSCDHDGTTITVTVYQDADQMKQMNEAFKDLASGVPVQGDAWQVGTDDASQAAQVQKIVGGKVG